MQKVDIAIAALGAVAILATGLGIGLYDDGNIDFVVTTSDDTTFSKAAENVPQGGLVWEIDVPDNTFHAGGEMVIDWSSTQAPSQAFSGNVDVTVTVTGPDGTMDTLTGTFPYEDLSGTVPFTVSSWAEVPEDFSGTEAEAEAMELQWNSPLHIEIIISGPTGQASGVPVEQLPDDPVYTAALDGYWHTYSITQPTPELGTV